jgi:aminopeptidase N
MQNVARLITQFVPEHYQLSLSLDRPNRLFKGIVTIQGTSPTDSGALTVHAKDLTIESATVDGKAATFAAGTDDALVITHPDIKTGPHIVVIAFSGKITDAMHGLYPCYFEYDGIKKELLATQFESHHAREVFPCIDEPEAKATFDLTLATEQNITVLGNMPVKSQAVENGWLVTNFNTTPRMSTYLLAWVIGEMHKKTAATKNGVEVNVWATPAQAPEKLDFALEHAVKTIEFFDEYFGIPYPLPKSDHVALPDFTSGAMENWGLITYREIALLAHPTTSSITSKQYVALVVAHELSHQWFGNLVTMKWWNNLWLNESFATLMEYVALDALHPEWDVWLDFSTMESILALRRDSIDGVQPVQTDVHHPDEISTLFDGAIVYAKGARLLRMLRQYIGEEAFRQGLQAYFQAHAYKNTEADDLWQALGKASGKDIAKFMTAWISQPGYPVVSVAKSVDEIQLRQQRFFIGPHQQSETLWPIPLNATDLPELLTTQELTVRINGTAQPRLNVGDTAHFLANYDSVILDGLVKQLDAFSPLDRLQLLHERTLLARGGEVSTASLVPLLKAYAHETSEPVWDIICLAVGELKPFVEGDGPSENQLKTLAATLARAQYQRLDWQPAVDEPETDTKLRANVIGLMLYSEDEEAIRTAIKLYRETDIDALNPELRSLVIGAAVRHGNDDAIFTNLIAHYQKSTAADVRQDIANGLSWTRDSQKIQQLLALLMDESAVRPQDVVKWFVAIIRSRDGREPAWKWMRENWAWIDKTFSGDKSYDYFPRFSANALRTQQQLDEYKSFFTPMQNKPALARVVAMGISEIEGRIALIERDQMAVRDTLAQH